MIAWNNAHQQAEVKSTKEKWNPKFGPNGPKLGQKFVFFLPISEVWFVSFPGNCIG